MRRKRSFARPVESTDGWTFEKSGYTFSVYRETNNDGTKGNYLILVSDTGLKIAEAKTKAGCPSEITPDIIDILNRPGNQKKLNACRDRFKNHMIDAGYMDPEKIQEPAPVQAAKKEDAAPVQEPEKIQEPAPVQTAKEEPAPTPKRKRGRPRKSPAPVQTKEEPAKVQEPAPLPTTCTLEQFAKHYTG